MTEKLFHIMLTGELESGITRDAAIAGFAKLFKIDLAKAETIFNNTPVAVKKNVDEATAQQYQQALKKIGLRCELKSAAPDLQQEERSITPTVVNPVVEPEKYLGWPYQLEGRPDYSFLTVKIPANQTLKVEASAMATMDTHINMKTKMKGGLGRFITGENIFINEFTAENAPGEIGIAPGTPGDLCHQYLDGEAIFLQNSAFVAATMGINVESKWQGMLKGFFSGESLFLIRCSGSGDLWFNTYGAMIEIDVMDDYVVDTGNIVAFTEGLEYSITRVGGYKSLFFSGEGFVCRFSGKGKVWIQTRSAAGFAAWAQYFRPVKG